ncbi:hypothetical protein T492DRAFT_844055 [Pavlovales sp. CCMP2436]|nr:hypothetical protein T492DRAFT_844055 [Pavlovales sp. CCMP2436]
MRLSPCSHLACVACVEQLRRAAIFKKRGVCCPACQRTVQSYLEPSQEPSQSPRAISADSAGRGGGRGAQPAREGKDGASGKKGRERAPVAKGSVLRGGRVGTPCSGSKSASAATIAAPAKPPPSAGQRTAAGLPFELADAEKNSEPWMFKTKMCKRWIATGVCSFEDTCWFAHGPTELRKPGLRPNQPSTCICGDGGGGAASTSPRSHAGASGHASSSSSTVGGSTVLADAKSLERGGRDRGEGQRKRGEGGNGRPQIPASATLPIKSGGAWRISLTPSRAHSLPQSPIASPQLASAADFGYPGLSHFQSGCGSPRLASPGLASPFPSGLNSPGLEAARRLEPPYWRLPEAQPFGGLPLPVGGADSPRQQGAAGGYGQAGIGQYCSSTSGGSEWQQQASPKMKLFTASLHSPSSHLRPPSSPIDSALLPQSHTLFGGSGSGGGGGGGGNGGGLLGSHRLSDLDTLVQALGQIGDETETDAAVGMYGFDGGIGMGTRDVETFLGSRGGGAGVPAGGHGGSACLKGLSLAELSGNTLRIAAGLGHVSYSAQPGQQQHISHYSHSALQSANATHFASQAPSQVPSPAKVSPQYNWFAGESDVGGYGAYAEQEAGGYCNRYTPSCGGYASGFYPPSFSPPAGGYGEDYAPGGGFGQAHAQYPTQAQYAQQLEGRRAQQQVPLYRGDEYAGSEYFSLPPPSVQQAHGHSYSRPPRTLEQLDQHHSRASSPRASRPQASAMKPPDAPDLPDLFDAEHDVNIRTVK